MHDHVIWEAFLQIFGVERGEACQRQKMLDPFWIVLLNEVDDDGTMAREHELVAGAHVFLHFADDFFFEHVELFDVVEADVVGFFGELDRRHLGGQEGHFADAEDERLAFVQRAHDEIHVADDALGLLRTLADAIPTDDAGFCDDARASGRKFDRIKGTFSQTAVAVEAV